MITFHQPVVADRDWVTAISRAKNNKSMDYSFGILYLWQELYQIEIAEKDGFLLGRSGFKGRCGKCSSHLYPLGLGDEGPIVEELLDQVKAAGNKMLFYGITDESKAEIEAKYPGRFVFEENRTTFEYIYTREKLATLAGKKYHSKRTQISKFERENPSWIYEAITAENLSECIEMYKEWYENEDLTIKEGLVDEQKVIFAAAKDFFALGYAGGLIRVNGRVVAFTFGEAISDTTFILHVEKANYDYAGSYGIINREFAAHLPQQFVYINREDDVGDDNMRHTKLSYHPEILLAKYHMFLASEYSEIEPFMDSLTSL